jgi:hypothetical protein
MTGLAGVFLLLLFRLALKYRPAAIVAFAFGVSIFGSVTSEHFWIAFFCNAVLNVAFVLLIVRVGLLAAVVAFYMTGLFIFFPMTSNLRAWYAGAGMTALLVIAAIALFGFSTALGGRPVLRRPALEN